MVTAYTEAPAISSTSQETKKGSSAGKVVGIILGILLIIILILMIGSMVSRPLSYQGGIPLVSHPDIRLGDYTWKKHGILDVRAIVDFQLINYADAGGSVIISFEFKPSGLYHQRQYYVPEKTMLSFHEDLDCKWNDQYLTITLKPA